MQGASGSTGITGASGVQGASGLIGSTGVQGPQGNFGGATFDYTFDTTITASDPGTGNIRFNNATLSSATAMYIDASNDASTDISTFLNTIDDSTSTIKGHFRISKKADASAFALYTITSLTNNTGWFTVNASYVSGNSTFANLDDIIVTFARTGDKGDTGLTGATGIQGVQGASGSTGLTGTTGPQGIQGASGSTGTAGTNGTTGPQGIQGASGATGIQGAAGTNGTNGAAGATGIQGAAGTNGTNGAAGTNGATGAAGTNGTNGAAGTNGATGAAGTSYTTASNVQLNSLGLGTAASTTAGELRATNNITAYYSDRRLKENIIPIENALEKLMQISGVYFNSNSTAEKYGYFDKKQQVGVIAQEIQAVLPQIVVPAPFDIGQNEDGTEYSKSGENYQTVQYDKIAPLLIEAIKELYLEVQKLK